MVVRPCAGVGVVFAERGEGGVDLGLGDRSREGSLGSGDLDGGVERGERFGDFSDAVGAVKAVEGEGAHGAEFRPD